MVKTRKQFRRQRRKANRKSTKKMVGGNLSDVDRIELLELGFSNEDFNLLEQNNLNMNLIRSSLQQNNPETGIPFTPQELIQDLYENDQNNELNISGISNASNDEHNFNDEDLDNSFTTMDDSINTTGDTNGDDSIILDENEDLNNSFMSDEGSLHLSDLNDDVSVNTTNEDISYGGKKRRKTMKKRRKGKKIRRTIKKRKNGDKSKTKRKQRGGCYGSGVGANNNDPNFSIYNTNLLKLFPYSPK